MAKTNIGISVNGKWFPRGSHLLLDEVCTARPGHPHVGAEMSVEDVATLIKDMWRGWGLAVKPRGGADDACDIRNDKGISIVDQFATAGVSFVLAEKDSRISGWQYMRELLLNASLERIDKPGLFVSDQVRLLVETVPLLSRSVRHRGADACQYGLVAKAAGPIRQKDF